MLSEKGILILEKLIAYNHDAVTAKTLATSIGMSERSVKTYLKEVADFCEEHGMKLDRKPGKGIKPEFSEEQICAAREMIGKDHHILTQKERQNYIAYILLSGWDTYTYALFSDELNVSKNVIVDDINDLSSEMETFGIEIHKMAGYGIYAKGEEFDVRKALRHFCRIPISDKQVINDVDYRLCHDAAEIIANNFRSVNLRMAAGAVHHVESDTNIVFTDYTFQMLVEYISIGLFRYDVGKELLDERFASEDIPDEYRRMAQKAAEYFETSNGLKLPVPEINYIAILFMCAEAQNCVITQNSDTESISDDIIVYLSNLLAANLIDNDLLSDSMRSYMPGSLFRTKYGIEIDNPFLEDITQSYGSLYTVCFAVSKFYEKYARSMPSEDEIAFIALQVGGALHRNPMIVRAILIGSTGFATGNIIAGKIENRIPDVKIVSILSSDRIGHMDEYDCDLILCTINTKNDIHNDPRFLHVSPLISTQDEKNIRNKCFELMTGHSAEVNEFSNMLSDEFIIFENKAKSKKDIIKRACQILIDKGCVQKEFARDVLEREKVEATAVGCNIAIPHGKPEHVNCCKILVVRLEQPIEWGERMVDMIFMLAINFDSVNTTKAFFHDFTKILNEHTVRDKLRVAKTPHELNLAIRSETGWS